MYVKTSDQAQMEMGFGNHQCNWGTHFCALYNHEDERDEIIFNFLHQGELDGDMQLYCPVEPSTEDFLKKYQKLWPKSCEKLHDSHYFSIQSAKELYYPQGFFSPADMDNGLNSFFHNSQKKGPRNIRATADMVWALETIPGIENLMVYESRLNYFIPGKPWVSICLYNINKFSGKIIMDALRTHPYTITGGTIMVNPYFENPDEWLRKNAPQYLPR